MISRIRSSPYLKLLSMLNSAPSAAFARAKRPPHPAQEKVGLKLTWPMTYSRKLAPRCMSPNCSHAFSPPLASPSIAKAKGGLNACEQFGDMQRGASFLEYVIGHVNLRPTFSGAGCGGRFALAKAADGAELSIERSFKVGEDRILEIIRHGGLLSMDQR